MADTHPLDDLEWILCAALFIDDGVARIRQPTPTGRVVCGWRHHHAIDNAVEIPGVTNAMLGGAYQGFLTSKGRYVGRYEAKLIARDAGQLVPNPHGNTEDLRLYSEDLY